MNSTPALSRRAGSARSVSLESLEKTRLSENTLAAYAARAVHEVRIAVGQATIAIRFARISAAGECARRFGDMLGQHTPEAVIYVVDVDGRAFFWRSPERVFCWPSEAADELLVFLADGFALREYLITSEDLGLHAAVIARGSSVVALVGTSTAGKTTTAIAAVRRGFTLYSDDRCIISDGRVVPFLRAITLREGGRAALLADAFADCTLHAPLREMPARGDVTIGARTLVGARAGGCPRPLAAAFIIEGRGATPAVEPCSLYGQLPVLMRSMICREVGLERAVRALAELRNVRFYRLRLGTPAATAHAIERTLNEAVADPKR
jgi:hypothetical protein